MYCNLRCLLNSDSIELIDNCVLVSNHSTAAARETNDRSQSHQIPIMFACLQPFLRQVACNQYVFASQSSRAVLTMPMLLGGVRFALLIRVLQGCFVLLLFIRY